MDCSEDADMLDIWNADADGVGADGEVQRAEDERDQGIVHIIRDALIPQ